MPLTIKFESPPGTAHPSLTFDPGQAVRVAGTFSSSLGGWVPEPGVPITLTLQGAGMPSALWQTTTDFWGNYKIDIVLPSSVGLATLQATAATWTGSDTTEVTIGIGVEGPPPPPPPSGNIFEQLVPILLLGLLAYVVVNSGIFQGRGGKA